MAHKLQAILLPLALSITPPASALMPEAQTLMQKCFTDQSKDSPPCQLEDITQGKCTAAQYTKLGQCILKSAN